MLAGVGNPFLTLIPGMLLDIASYHRQSTEQLAIRRLEVYHAGTNTVTLRFIHCEVGDST